MFAAALKIKSAMLGLIEDLDTVLASDDGFLLGSWLEAAKRAGSTSEEKALYEWNARSQITLCECDYHRPSRIHLP